MGIDLAALCMSAPAAAGVDLPFTNGSDPVFTVLPADDTRIQAIINAAAVGHHLAWIPPGLYTLNNPVVFPADSIQLLGCGASTVFVNMVPDAAGTGFAFELANRSGCALRNFLIIEDPVGVPANGHHVSLNASHRTLINKVNFQHTFGGRACIHPHDNDSDYVRMFQNRFAISGGVDYGIDNFGMLNYGIVAKNQFANQDTAIGIFHAGGAAAIIYSVIKDNIFGDPSGSSAWGISLQDVWFVSITGNSRFGDTTGFMFLDTCLWCAVYGNNGIGAGSFIRLDDCEDCAITGNSGGAASPAVGFAGCVDCVGYGNSGAPIPDVTGQAGVIEMGNSPTGLP